ncbi:hypothetical protein [Novosphingobium rosa]|nr:hypothetical protein [Novosphingobium rosa]
MSTSTAETMIGQGQDPREVTHNNQNATPSIVAKGLRMNPMISQL